MTGFSTVEQPVSVSCWKQTESFTYQRRNERPCGKRTGFSILYTFSEQTAVDETALSQRFRDMFIVDTLIGNWDRHNGNWGFLYNAMTDEMELAPVYDCGSSLYPQADDKIMASVLANEKERDFRIIEIPTSAIMMKGKKIRIAIFGRSAASVLYDNACNA